LLVVEQITVIRAAERLAEPGCGIRSDSQEPVGQASLVPVPYPVQALADGDRHRCRLGLAGECGEFLDELMSLGVLDVEAHFLPFYPTLATKVPFPAGPPPEDGRRWARTRSLKWRAPAATAASIPARCRRAGPARRDLLTPAERTLLGDWLDRIAESERAPG
jgi:hypothetical protein